MKAVVYTEYGQPDALQLEEIEKPVPKSNEVLVKIHAASINDWDLGLLRGEPFMNRLFFGLLKPRINILGSDIAGQVEAAGADAKKFHPGDEVFGDLSNCGFGGFAEYVCAHEDVLVSKPSSMTFEQAAAMPQAATLALQGLRDKREIKQGQRVLINGAGGGAGTFAIQIAKSYGAEVTGVDSTVKLDVMRSSGADHVIDYTKEDFTKIGRSYDFILDFAAHHAVSDYWRALNANGAYIMVGGSTSLILQVMILGPMISMITSKKMGILMYRSTKDLLLIKELFESDVVRPVIDKCYPLRNVPEAFRYFEEGRHRGKVVITLAAP